MARTHRKLVVSRHELELRLLPRDDFVLEHRSNPAPGPEAPAGQAKFTYAEGPFERWDRELCWEKHGNDYAIEETTTFRLHVPVWGPLFTLLVRMELRRRNRRQAMPWWAPPDRLDPLSATALGYLLVLTLVAGYLGSLLSQTIAFAGREFDASESAQSNLAGWVRVGVPIAFAMGVIADRLGRRRTILWAGTFGCVLAAATAASPNFFGYGVTQAIARGMSTALGLLIGIAAAEETPSRSRAYVTSIMAMTAGLGSGMVVWLVPLTDLGERAWRILFLVPLIALIPIGWMWRRLPETRRFAQLQSGATLGPPQRTLGRRFALLAIAFLMLSAFAAPASTLHSTFLTQERGYSGAEVTLFRLVTSTPVGIGLLIAGRLADTRGRRLVGAVGLIVGAVATTMQFIDAGWRMWAWGLIGTVIGAASVPAIGVYGPEMFSTRSRSRANGALVVVATAGSAIGLVTVGWALQRWDFGTTFSALALLPIIVAVVLVRLLPETAAKSLEELNPEDERSNPALP